jgi:hypothetical protein
MRIRGFPETRRICRTIVIGAKIRPYCLYLGAKSVISTHPPFAS